MLSANSFSLDKHSSTVNGAAKELLPNLKPVDGFCSISGASVLTGADFLLSANSFSFDKHSSGVNGLAKVLLPNLKPPDGRGAVISSLTGAAAFLSPKILPVG